MQWNYDISLEVEPDTRIALLNRYRPLTAVGLKLAEDLLRREVKGLKRKSLSEPLGITSAPD